MNEKKTRQASFQTHVRPAWRNVGRRMVGLSSFVIGHFVIVSQPPSHSNLPFFSLTTTMDLSNEIHNPTPTATYPDHHADALTVHAPDSKQPALASALLANDYTPCKTMFADADWINPELRLHVESLFPSQDAIMAGTGVCDKLAFKEACTVLFKKGRTFSSLKQLKQVTALFLDKWGGQCSQHGK
jgi:hypothetical protein